MGGQGAEDLGDTLSQKAQLRPRRPAPSKGKRSVRGVSGLRNYLIPMILCLHSKHER